MLWLDIPDQQCCGMSLSWGFSLCSRGLEWPSLREVLKVTFLFLCTNCSPPKKGDATLTVWQALLEWEWHFSNKQNHTVKGRCLVWAISILLLLPGLIPNYFLHENSLIFCRSDHMLIRGYLDQGQECFVMRAGFGCLGWEVLGAGRGEEGLWPDKSFVQSLTSFIQVPLHSAFYRPQLLPKEGADCMVITHRS